MKAIYIPDLGLLLGLWGGYNAGLPGGFLFGPGLPVSLVLALTVALVLRRRGGEALRAHNSWDVLLSSLSGLGDGFWYYPIGLLLLLMQIWLHLMVCPPWHPLLRWGAGWGWRRRRRGSGGGRAALHRGTEDPHLATGTIGVFSRLRGEKNSGRSLLFKIVIPSSNTFHK